MDDDSDTVQTIVALEWDMFQAVNEGGPRASCQNDRSTFEGMRRGQFEAWSEDVRASYLSDLRSAVSAGRNLVNEKYIHMMEHSSPDRYEILSGSIPMPDAQVRELASRIADKLIGQTEVLASQFPRVCGTARPLRSTEDSRDETSVESYQTGELLTYSAKTLELLKRHLLALDEEGRSLARILLENSVRFGGFASLEEAEAALEARARDQHAAGGR